MTLVVHLGFGLGLGLAGCSGDISSPGAPAAAPAGAITMAGGGAVSSTSSGAGPGAPGAPASVSQPASVIPSAGDMVTLHTSDAASARRQALIQFLWGADGFPATALPTSVDLDVPTPVTGLSNLARVDELHFQMDAGVESFAYHFIPLTGTQARAVILHQGHSPVLDDDHSLADVSFGMQRTVDNLLTAGYAVLAMYMPGCLPPASGCTIPHEQIVELPTTGNGIKFFLEPVARGLNYLETQAAKDGFTPYTDVAMVGLSGGGWTTTVYAALDPRITLSIPVAGSLPLPMRNAVGDEEQFLPAFYAIADYPDLYALGALGPNRRQIQVLNRHDDCCFGENPAEFSDEGTGQSFDTAVRSYEIAVRKALAEMGSGDFRLEIDEAAPAHMISWNAIASVILEELRVQARPQPAPGTEAFARGPSGTLLHTAADGQVTDTGIAIVGTPAAIALPGGGGYELFARDPHNQLIHAVEDGAAWSAEPLGALLITDPVAVLSGPSARLDVAALAPTYLPEHWSRSGSSWASETVPDAPMTFGPPHLRESRQGQLDLVARDFTHAPFRLQDDADGVWTTLPVTAAGP